MKKILLLIFVCLFSFTSIYSQHFIGDVSFNGRVAVFSIKAEGGDISDKVSGVDYYIRWAQQGEGSDFTFSSITNNLASFPGLNMSYFINDVTWDPGYYDVHFYYTGMTTTVKTYTNGVWYEVFRVTFGGIIPPEIELVADNTMYDPYLFNISGQVGADHSPTGGIDPFPSATRISGDFFGKKFDLTSMITLPIVLKSFTGKVVDCNASLEWTTSSELNGKYFDIEYSSDGINFAKAATVAASGNITGESTYTKSLPLTTLVSYYRLKMISTDDKAKYSNVILLKAIDCKSLIPFTVQATPNPVTNHELRLSVSAAKDDVLDIKVLDMAGKLIGQYPRHINAGTNQVIIHLSVNAGGQYLLKVNSPKNGTANQKIFVE